MHDLSLKNKTQIVYGLYAASLLFPPLAIVGFILAYQMRHVTQGTWLDSHCRWQIKTFWIGLAGTLLGFLTAVLYVGWLVLIVTSLWVLYRVIRGWVRLADQEAVETIAFGLI
jgi:uncharacterized membrane protein